MPLRNLLSAANKAGLPDLGVSESLFGVTTRGQSQAFPVGEGVQDPGLARRQAGVSQGAVQGPVLPSGQFRSQGQVAGLTTGGESSAGATGAPSGAASAANVIGVGQPAPSGPSFEDITRQAQQDAERRAAEAAAQSQISARDIFSPIVADLDAQLAALPGERGTLERGVDLSALRSSEFVKGERDRQLQKLLESGEKVQQQGKRTLRSLGEDVNRALQAAGRFIGGIGAGDSSAQQLAARAIGRQGLRQRGQAQEFIQQQVGDIENRKFEVERIASDRLEDINRQKEQQLNQIASDFQRIRSELNSQKAGATSDERRFLASQEAQLQDQLRGRLNQLNDEVRSAQLATQEWTRARQADLADTAARLSRKGGFNTQGAIQTLQQFNVLRDAAIAQGFSPQEADNFAASQVGIDLLQPPSEQEEEELKNLRLRNQQLEGELTLGADLGQNQGLIPDSVPLLGGL